MLQLKDNIINITCKINFLFHNKGLSEPNAILLTHSRRICPFQGNYFWLRSSRASSPKLFDLSTCFLNKIKDIGLVGREQVVSFCRVWVFLAHLSFLQPIYGRMLDGWILNNYLPVYKLVHCIIKIFLQ